MNIERKILNNFMLIVFFGIGVFIFSHCMSPKETISVSNSFDLNMYDSNPEYQSNTEYFRTYAIGESEDYELAREEAHILASQQLLQSIETVVDNTLNSYYQSNEENLNEKHKFLLYSQTFDKSVFLEIDLNL